MRTIELANATAPLADYARGARQDPVIVTENGEPIAALVDIAHVDQETLSLSTNPEFLAIIERSEARLDAEGGLTLDEVCRRLGIPDPDEPVDL